MAQPHRLTLSKGDDPPNPPSIDNNPIPLAGTLRALTWHSLPFPFPPLPLHPYTLTLIDRFQSEPPFPSLHSFTYTRHPPYTPMMPRDPYDAPDPSGDSARVTG
jgi:hypothetical protein